MISAATAAIIGAGISAAGALGGTIANNEYKKNEAELAFERQKRENELAYSRQLQQIKEQNAYNSPSAQMARMAAAGLNPNLMYQQGEQGLQSDIPRYEGAEYNPADYNSPVQPLGNVGSMAIESLVGLKDMENKTLLAESQVALNASTANFNISQTDFTNAQKERMMTLLGWEVREKNINIQFKESEIKKLEADVVKVQKESDLLVAQKGLTEAEAGKASAEERTILALLPSRAEWAAMEIEEKRAAVSKAYAEIKYMEKNWEIDKFNSRVNLANCITNGIVGIGSVAAKFLGKGASLADVFGTNPWQIMKQQRKGTSVGSDSGGYYDIGDESWLPGD